MTGLIGAGHAYFGGAARRVMRDSLREKRWAGPPLFALLYLVPRVGVLVP